MRGLISERNDIRVRETGSIILQVSELFTSMTGVGSHDKIRVQFPARIHDLVVCSYTPAVRLGLLVEAYDMSDMSDMSSHYDILISFVWFWVYLFDCCNMSHTLLQW